MKRKIFSTILAAMLIISVFPQTGFAAETDERTKTVEYITTNKIFVGDGTGNLNLESGLTRAELAVLLTRLRGDEAKVNADIANYSLNCYFTDVPAWAKPFVGYCADEGLMVGYSLFQFGAADKVTPQQACTVILRHKGYPETDWNYATAISKATSAGLAPTAGFSDMVAIKRIEMAILIYKAETGGANTTDNNQNLVSTKVLDGSSFAREDFSLAANPAVFDDYYTREIYNVIRQVILDQKVIADKADENGFNPYYSYPHAIGHDKTYFAIDTVFGNISAYHQYKSFGEPYVKNIWEYPSYCSATVNPRNQFMQDVDKATDAIVAQASTMPTTAEKVQYFNDYLRSRIIYDSGQKAGTLLEIFTSANKVYGVCGNYANAFQYLCDKAGIPVISVTGNSVNGVGHGWNMVYDGSWLYVDVTSNIVLTSSYSFAVDETPKLTTFLKEILIPSSTK